MVYDWNAAAHADEAEGEPERRAFTRPELEAFFDHADEEVLRVRGKGRKGWLPAFRDAAFKTVYAYGLRRNEIRMQDLTDFSRNPDGREFGEYGTLLVRHAKAKKGSPPKRRSVLTVWTRTPGTIEERITEVRPGMRRSTIRALWPSERGARIGVQRLDSRFAAYRDAVGLDPAPEFHSLRRSYITHLIEDGHDPLFVQQQVGHDRASTTAIYTCVSSHSRTRSLRRVPDATIEAALRPGRTSSHPSAAEPPRSANSSSKRRPRSSRKPSATTTRPPRASSPRPAEPGADTPGRPQPVTAGGRKLRRPTP
ncbi:tyrosine-type recombinase/integrase [Streptomyces luteogriseus]|uniref:tyrosine-type recombinase/integrase n=1 Tax=Streptomyces luteogriseus TaxID=68233 RepID=UPI0037B67344